jgi:hypothetical protein
MLSLFVLGLGALTVSAAEGPDAAVALREKVSPAVLTLFSVDPRFQWPSYQGSGFLISEDGILVTARHVSESESDLFVVTADGRKFEVTGFFGEDRDYDIAVLKIDGKALPHLTLATYPLPQTNQWVAVVSPETNGGTLCATGLVRSVPALQDLWEVISTSIQMRHGQSGSPLLDESGAVLGVVSGLDDESHGSAMPVKIVRRLLPKDEAPVPFSQRPRHGDSLPLVGDKEFRTIVLTLSRDDWRHGQKQLQHIAGRFPESPTVQLLLGAACIKSESWKQAYEALTKVVRLRPESGLAWYLLGVASAGHGRYEESDLALKKSIKLGFPNPEQLTSAWELMALNNAQRRNLNGLKEAMENLKRLDPSEASACARRIQHDFPGITW